MKRAAAQSLPLSDRPRRWRPDLDRLWLPRRRAAARASDLPQQQVARTRLGDKGGRLARASAARRRPLCRRRVTQVRSGRTPFGVEGRAGGPAGRPEWHGGKAAARRCAPCPLRLT
eukprot:56953-Chlamydomonas_euryale.AAC.2